MRRCLLSSCDKVFTPNTPKQVYCCKKCANASYRLYIKGVRITPKRRIRCYTEELVADRNSFDWLQA